jgi:hypothetical protein
VSDLDDCRDHLDGTAQPAVAERCLTESDCRQEHATDDDIGSCGPDLSWQAPRAGQLWTWRQIGKTSRLQVALDNTDQRENVAVPVDLKKGDRAIRGLLMVARFACARSLLLRTSI